MFSHTNQVNHVDKIKNFKKISKIRENKVLKNYIIILKAKIQCTEEKLKEKEDKQ